MRYAGALPGVAEKQRFPARETGNAIIKRLRDQDQRPE